jgi:hypothetical protein
MGRPKTRLFPIRPDPDFFTGVCDDGRQVIIGLLCPELVAVFFDGKGNHLGCEERPWSAAVGKLAGRKPPYKIGGDRFRDLIAEQVREWQGELGARQSTIRVKKFLAGAHMVGIDELPGWAHEIETATWMSDAERQQYREDRDQWVADGKFVFWWAKSYHMSKDGEVEST